MVGVAQFLDGKITVNASLSCWKKTATDGSARRAITNQSFGLPAAPSSLETVSEEHRMNE